MRDFEVFFDHGEHSAVLDPVMARYGKLGFPQPPRTRPWIFANFVQSMDGIISLLDENASGSDIAQSEEDRWLMDVLRAHADAVLFGTGTLLTETALGRPRPRGPVFRIADPSLQQLRMRTGRGRERNIFVTSRAELNFADYAVFDGDKVDTIVITSEEGAAKLEPQKASHPWVEIVAAGASHVDLQGAVRQLYSRYGIRHLLFEGGPLLYSSMIEADLIDEKFLTVAPLEVGQFWNGKVRPTVLPNVGFSKKNAIQWDWISCRKVGNHQFHRFRRRRVC